MSEIKGEEEFDYPGLLCSLHSLHLYQIMVNSEISNFKREFTFTFSILSSAATKAIFKNKSHRISWFGGLFRIRRSLANRFRTNHPQDQNTTKYCCSITGVRISLLLISICLAQIYIQHFVSATDGKDLRTAVGKILSYLINLSTILVVKTRLLETRGTFVFIQALATISTLADSTGGLLVFHFPDFCQRIIPVNDNFCTWFFFFFSIFVSNWNTAIFQTELTNLESVKALDNHYQIQDLLVTSYPVFWVSSSTIRNLKTIL